MPTVPTGDRTGDDSPEETRAAASRATTYLTENAFFVLGLSHEASALEVERTGQKLIGMLELGHAGAAVYKTPLGPFERTAERVRQSVARLRDPDKRFVDEIWARAAQRVAPTDAERLLDTDALWWWGNNAAPPTPDAS